MLSRVLYHQPRGLFWCNTIWQEKVWGLNTYTINCDHNQLYYISAPTMLSVHLYPHISMQIYRAPTRSWGCIKRQRYIYNLRRNISEHLLITQHFILLPLIVALSSVALLSSVECCTVEYPPSSLLHLSWHWTMDSAYSPSGNYKHIHHFHLITCNSNRLNSAVQQSDPSIAFIARDQIKDSSTLSLPVV